VSKTSYPRALLFGRWYRNDIDENGNETVEYAQLSSDGSFEFTFITLNMKGDIIEQLPNWAIGDWWAIFILL